MLKYKFISLIFIIAILLSAMCQTKKEIVMSKSDKIETKESFFKDISVKDFYELAKEYENGGDFVIIDFRTKSEYSSGYIKNSTNLDFYDNNLKNNLNNLDKNKTYLIYCRSGNRSGQALKIMKDLGFKKVYNMIGGIIDWESKKYPLEK